MSEYLPQIIFYVFGALTLLSAFLVITQNNPVRCVLFLVLAFFTSSVLWILVQAEFLALILVLVYVGAVMTLFLFVVMMLNIDTESIKRLLLRHLPVGFVVVVLLTGLLMATIPKGALNTSVKPSVVINQIMNSDFVPDSNQITTRAVSNTEALGLVLYTDYVFAFELAAVILLVAIIAAITLVHRNPRQSKRQDIVKQIMTRREDRVRLVKIKPGK